MGRLRPFGGGAEWSPYAGVGLKPQHYGRSLTSYELSVHGVGLSIGSDGPLDREHLLRLRGLLERYEPEVLLRAPRQRSLGRFPTYAG